MSRTDRASLLIHVHRDDVFTALTIETALLSLVAPIASSLTNLSAYLEP